MKLRNYKGKHDKYCTPFTLFSTICIVCIYNVVVVVVVVVIVEHLFQFNTKMAQYWHRFAVAGCKS